MNCLNEVKATGDVKAIIEYKNGKKYELSFPNMVLLKGRAALAQMLTNTLGFCPTTTDTSTTGLVPALYINAMLFGTNGAVGLTPKIVTPKMDSLFGVAVATKQVNSYVNQDVTTQAIFNSTLLYADAPLAELSEMALKMTNGELYSLVTFPPITKTTDMQITFNWTLNFV